MILAGFSLITLSPVAGQIQTKARRCCPGLLLRSCIRWSEMHPGGEEALGACKEPNVDGKGRPRLCVPRFGLGWVWGR